MIDRWFKKVKYYPEIRVETIIQNIPGNTTIKTEEVKNLQGQLPGAKIAIIGFQAQGNPGIYHGFIADEEYYNEIYSLGLQGLDACDEKVYYEATKSISITSRNIANFAVTDYKFRHTWVVWNPEKIAQLINLQTPVYERFDMPLSIEARTVIERAFKPIRKEVYNFFGNVTQTPITLVNKLVTKPDEIFVLEEFAASKMDVVVDIYREGETEAGESFICSMMPENLTPLKLWLPATNEIKIEIHSPTGASNFIAKAKISIVKPVDKSVIPTISVR